MQQALLKLVEGSVYTLNTPYGEIEFDTSNILFIASGAFVGLDEIKKGRHSKTNIGFGADLNPSIMEDADSKDLIKFGMIPEFIGRFPIIAEVKELTKENMLDILNTVENNLVSQYKHLFNYNKIKISFRKDALTQIVNIAMVKKTGARGLRAIMEKSLLPHMFNINKYEKNNINRVVITKSLINQPKEIKKK